MFDMTPEWAHGLAIFGSFLIDYSLNYTNIITLSVGWGVVNGVVVQRVRPINKYRHKMWKHQRSQLGIK